MTAIFKRFVQLFCLLLSSSPLFGQTDRPTPRPDLATQPTLYAVGYAHLDTEWRWEYPQVIGEYLPKTMRNNFALFAKYPHYIFNFSGSNRYRMMKEYYPADYATLKRYVAAKRWFPAGSSVEESDVNSPSAESIFRQILYGNEYFRRDFGVASAEYMLPDCFGFPASLPSILAHAGVKGFSTQKLTWGSSAAAGGPGSAEHTPLGTPFNVGIWEGPDGRSVLAAFNPGSYGADITSDMSKPLPLLRAIDSTNAKEQERRFWRDQDDWARRVQHNGEASGVFTDYRYYGTGDVGGAPTESSVRLLEAIIQKREGVVSMAPEPDGSDKPAPTNRMLVGDGPVKVISASADQMFLDIKPTELARLPHYKGELELTNHSAGSLTSEAYQKRWNRKNELLADAAEKASVSAAWLGSRPYPQERINNAWTLVLGGQFHDIMAGTATPKSYEYAWNDEVLAMNQFASVLKSAAAGVIGDMDTRSKGIPIVVYNPLNVSREDVVEAEVSFAPGTAKGVRIVGPDGKEVPSQLETAHGSTKVLFLARVPSVGWSVYDVQASDAPDTGSELKVSDSGLENGRYRVQVDGNGDVSSLFDKKLNKELLSGPARLAFQTEKPYDWPAWNMDWADQQKPPRGYVQGPAKVRIIENGPARVALEIEREAEGSKFVQTIRLSAGDTGNRVEFANFVDWKTKEAALKATFPLTAGNRTASYNWDIGTIERENNSPKKFEVASHQWFDLTDADGSYGVTVLSDCKYGSDKPDDHTLRLTLIYTPGLGGGIAYPDQTMQDWGRHEFVYGLAGHDHDWRKAETDWEAYRLNQPLIGFRSSPHPGMLGKEFSLLKVGSNRVRVLALKKAEHSDEVIVRVVELDGKPAQKVRFAFGAPLLGAREVNGQEMPLGAAALSKGELVTDFTPFQTHTFAVKLAPPVRRSPGLQWKPLSLPYDVSVATSENRPAQGCFDCSFDDPTAPQGASLPAEMLPTSLDYDGISFRLAAATGKPNAMTAHAQTLDLPNGDFRRIYLLAAAAHGDTKATFLVDGRPTDLKIQEWTGYIGQWDNRTWQSHLEPEPADSQDKDAGAPLRMRTVTEFAGNITPGFIKPADVAWFASHRHSPSAADEPYTYSYLFAYAIDIPVGAKKLTLPDNPEVRILAITTSSAGGDAPPAQPLYDTLPLDRSR
ncbi:MAG TPA: glycoside hydrolase family 38 C-terminal domain-containing protein [Terriglobales bacterium]|nr:glycoside hydrolase family 38 C-terminal domain-containing protein [Terriglobales bacterium]